MTPTSSTGLRPASRTRLARSSPPLQVTSLPLYVFALKEVPVLHGLTRDSSLQLKIVGSTKTPFAVKGGGHITNQGFSSTTGVQIALTKFKDIVLSTDKATVKIGAGNVWDDVYLKLNGTGVNAPGARVPGVGVPGFTLGGGKS